MIRKFLIATAILTFVLTPALAAQSMTKVYKISVTLPASIELSANNISEKTPTAPEIGSGQTTEKMVITANNQKILLRTTVAK